ncbi:family 43 glycosylhydrolase [Glaciibacter superstes]|uniref:family 43 glycosylhydrolase n=1 Tax=Glaciibacter superstes TaxID=501023 RepID=UPI00042625F4|nr:family 43 glycosylhydrolase [Glaciibacter superstes]
MRWGTFTLRSAAPRSATLRAAAVLAAATMIGGGLLPSADANHAAAAAVETAEETPAASGTYTNPVSAGVVDTFPDPAMIRGKDGAWYAYGTTNPIFNSAGETGEHILPMMRSTDLVSWEYIGDVYPTDAERPGYWAAGTRPWAPDIRYIDGEYHLTYSLSNGGVAMLTAQAPTGPWVDHGLIIPGAGVAGCPTGNIDQALFTDSDGTHYVYWGSYDVLCVSELNADATALAGEVTQVAQGRRMEGGIVMQRDGWYYLMYSDAGCCDGEFSGYTVKVGRADNPRGPFLDDDGVDLMAPSSKGGFVLTSNGNGFAGTGHNTIQTDLAGQDWLIYHAIPTADPDFPPVDGRTLSKRPLMIDRLDWIDGWPVVRAGAGPSNGEETAPVTTPLVGTDFTNTSLDDWKVKGDGEATIASDPDAGEHLRLAAEGTAKGNAKKSGSAAITSHDTVSGDLRVQADVRLSTTDAASATSGAVGLVVGQRGQNGATAWIDRAAGELRVEVVHGSKVAAQSSPLPASFDYGSWHVVTLEWRGSSVTAEVSADGLRDPLATVEVTAPKQAQTNGTIGIAATAASVDADNLSAAEIYTPVTERVADPAVGELLPEYSDEFDAAGAPEAGDDAWNWVRRPASRPNVSDGSLVWPTQGAELYQATNSAPVLLRDAPNGDYVVETKLIFDGTKGAQQAGLVLYEHDDRYLKLTHSVLPLNRKGEFLHQTEFGKEAERPTTTPPTAVANGPMFGAAPAETTWLRLYAQLDEENGEYDVRMASSTDGESWQWGGVWSIPALGNLRIGIVSMNAEGATAEFDYVHTYAMDGESSAFPASWPLPMPYGTADGRSEITPRPDNSMVLDLETRPQDAELGRVWMRDTYVNRFEVDGETLYVATGTTKPAELDKAAPWNDGIYVWTAPSLEGPWTLVDTTSIRPDETKGKVWSPEFVGENTDDRVVVADWQTYKNPDDPATRAGDVWAPEVHYVDGKWYIVACMGDHSKLTGSFMLVSDGGPEGPYRNIEGSVENPLGDPVRASNPQYYHIDGGLFDDGDETYLVLHNDLYSRMTADMEDLEAPHDLPRFEQAKFSPEPYLEGATVTKVGDKYYLMHAVWANKSGTALDPTWSYLPNSGVKDQYDAMVAVSDSFEGPYSARYTAAVGAGHNNMFIDEDGTPWMTFFRNPAHGYWASPGRSDEAAVAGVVRLEQAGPQGAMLYAERPSTDAASD